MLAVVSTRLLPSCSHWSTLHIPNLECVGPTGHLHAGITMECTFHEALVERARSGNCRLLATFARLVSLLESLVQMEYGMFAAVLGLATIVPFVMWRSSSNELEQLRKGGRKQD